MSSVLHALDRAQAPNLRPPGIPACYWITLTYIRSKCQGDPTAVSAEEIGKHYADKIGKPIKEKRLLGERHKRWLRDHGYLQSTTGFFNRIRILFTPTPKKPPGQTYSRDTTHDTGQAKCFKFSSFSDSDIHNKESRESSASSGSKNGTKDGVWRDLVEHVKQQTGQTLQDWQVGLIARDGKRAGVSLSVILQSLINGRHALDRWKNAFAVLLTLARNAMARPFKAQSAEAPPKSRKEERETRKREEARRKREIANEEIMKFYFGANYAVQS